MKHEEMIRMIDITKIYPGVRALDGVSFEVHRGEIQALLGENGAGKTTLMKVLYGMIQPESGHMEKNGQTVSFRNPMQAIASGIGMVHQHFMLADAMTVLENVIAGAEPVSGGRIDLAAAQKKVSDMIERFRFAVSPADRIEDLTVGEKQQVEILKVLYRDAEILILDEPTAVLSPQEVERFFQVLRNMKNEGKSCIIITHKLYEVLQIADRVTIMRNGVVTGAVPPEEMKDVSVQKLTEYMVGTGSPAEKTASKERIFREPVLEVRGLTFRQGGKELLRNVSFDLRKGEILGVAGVEGNGQSELVKALTGVIRPDSMELLLEGKAIRGNCADFTAAGVGHIPEDRLKDAVAADLSIAENMILGYHKDPLFCGKGIMKNREIRAVSEERVRKYRIKTPDVQTTVAQLSGGNQQKVVVARAFEADTKVLICSQMTRGVDIATSSFFYSLLEEYRDKGGAILLVSSDLQEIMEHCDTIAVMYQGELVFRKSLRETGIEEIGMYMTGGRPETEKERAV